MFQKALTHIDNVGDPTVWMQVGKMYDLIKNNKVIQPGRLLVLYLALVPGCSALSGGAAQLFRPQ